MEFTIKCGAGLYDFDWSRIKSFDDKIIILWKEIGLDIKYFMNPAPSTYKWNTSVLNKTQRNY